MTLPRPQWIPYFRFFGVATKNNINDRQVDHEPRDQIIEDNYSHAMACLNYNLLLSEDEVLDDSDPWKVLQSAKEPQPLYRTPNEIGSDLEKATTRLELGRLYSEAYSEKFRWDKSVWGSFVSQFAKVMQDVKK